MFVEQNENGKRTRLGLAENILAHRKVANGAEPGPQSRNQDAIANTNEIIAAPRDTGLSVDTPIATPDGMIAIGDLTPGQSVLTANGDTAKIRNILPATPTKAALRIRAPYFGLQQDVIIGARNTFDITDELAEYMFDTPRIRVPAWALRDNQRVFHHELTSRDMLAHLHLDRTDGFALGRSFLSPFASPQSTKSFRVLNDSEARAFVAEQKLGRYN